MAAMGTTRRNIMVAITVGTTEASGVASASAADVRQMRVC